MLSSLRLPQVLSMFSSVTTPSDGCRTAHMQPAWTLAACMAANSQRASCHLWQTFKHNKMTPIVPKGLCLTVAGQVTLLAAAAAAAVLRPLG
jgi:hypothetical protein